MKSITIEIRVDLIPFIEEAIQLKRDNPDNYKGSNFVNVVDLAKRLSAIRQDIAFTRALERVGHDTENVNISTEPIRLSEDSDDIIYHATYSLASDEQLTLFSEKHGLAEEAITI